MRSHIDPASIFLNYTVEGVSESIPFAMVDSTLRDSIRQAVAQGLGIGCGLMLLLISWFVINNKKTPMFLLHQVSLLFLVVRSSLYLGYLLGPLNAVSFQYTGLLYHHWDAYQTTVAVNVFYVLLVVSVEVIFVYQVFVIFRSTANRILGFAVTITSFLLAIAVTVVYIINTVSNLESARAKLLNGVTSFSGLSTNLPFILFSVSLNFTCVILTVKLFLAVRTRRVLGLRQFDAFHILLIMFVQTSIIPSVMVIYNYTVSYQSPVYINLSLIVTVCNLPLCSLWASTSNNAPTPHSWENSVFHKESSDESSDSSSEYKVRNGGFVLEKMTDDAVSLNSAVSIDRVIDHVEKRLL